MVYKASPLYSAEHSKCNRMIKLGFKALEYALL